MSSFEDATRIEKVDEGDFTWSVPDGWQQGRGAWGGLAVGALVRSVAANEPDDSRTVRSISAQLTAPALVGAHRISVRPQRIGSSMSTWGVAAVSDDGEAVANGIVITGRPRTREGTDHRERGVTQMPAAPALGDVPRIRSGPPFPVFSQQLAYHPVAGLPLSGAPAETLGWIGYGAPTRLDAAALLALVDGWWTANVVGASGMPRIATVNFLATLLADPASVDSDDALLSHGWVAAADEGFTSEHRQLWSPDGRLIVDNLQTIVVGA